MTKLIIAGDSWGCGSWSAPDAGMFDRGDDYLANKFCKVYSEVINLSIGGISNLTIYSNLKNWLRHNPIGRFEEVKFLVIQTDPVRDMILGINYWIEDDCSTIFEKISVSDYVNTSVELYYYNLNSLAKKYNIKINVSGGCSDVVGSIAKYSNLHVACSSVYQLLSSNHKLHAISCTFEINKVIDKFTDSNAEILEAHYKKQEIQYELANNVFGWHNDNHLTHKGIDLWFSRLYLI